MTEALLIASESISVLAAPEALLIVFHSLTSFIWGPLRPSLSSIVAIMIPYSMLVHCTGGVLVLLNARGASKLAERATEPAEGLIDSWEAEVFREKLGTIPEI